MFLQFLKYMERKRTGYFDFWADRSETLEAEANRGHFTY